MNLTQLKAMVLKIIQGAWTDASSLGLLESEIFTALQQAEADFLLTHPIRVLDDDDEHASWQRYATNPLSVIRYEASGDYSVDSQTITEDPLVLLVTNLPDGITVGDQFGWIERLQSDGVAVDAAGMPYRWATIETLSVPDNDVTTVTFNAASSNMIIDGDRQSESIFSQVPDSEKEFPGQLRDSLAYYAMSLIEQNADVEKSLYYKATATRIWNNIGRYDAINQTAQSQRGSSPYA